MNCFVELLKILPLWVLFSLALTQVGRLFFAWVRYPFGDEIEEGCYSFGLGAALLATAIWILGLFSALHFSAVSALSAGVLVLSLVTFKSFLSWLRSFFYRLKTLIAPQNLFEFFLIGIAALTFLLTLAAVASPQLGRDALAYHFYCPKQFIQQGSLQPVPFSVNSVQPLLVQMLYLQGLLFHSELFAKLYNFGFVLGTALLMAVAGRALAVKSRGLVAGLVLAVAPGFMSQAPYAYTDIALSFFLFLSFFALWRYFQEAKFSLLIGSAIFSGFALSAKLLALPTVAALFGLLVWHLFSSRTPGKLRAISIFAFFVLLPSVGWYLRSYWITGNPIFPYFNHWFTGREWASDIRDQTGIGRGLFALLKAPMLLFTDPEPFGGGDSQLGVLPLVVAPLLVTMGLKKPGKRMFFFLAGFQFLVWFYLVQHFRFIFPWVPVLYLGTGIALENLFGDKDGAWRPYKMLVLGAILLQALLIFYYNGKLSRYVRHPSRESYLAATERSFEIESWINGHLDKDAYVLLVNEPSQYYLDRRSARQDIVLGLGSAVQKQGFTHLLVRETPHNSYPGPSGRFKLIHEQNFLGEGDPSYFKLYELTNG